MNEKCSDKSSLAKRFRLKGFGKKGSSKRLFPKSFRKKGVGKKGFGKKASAKRLRHKGFGKKASAKRHRQPVLVVVTNGDHRKGNVVLVGDFDIDDFLVAIIQYQV